MDNEQDIMADLEAIAGGEVADQPPQTSEPEVEFGGTKMTLSEAQKVMKDWEANNTKTRQSEKERVSEMQRQIQALAEMRGVPADSVKDITAATVKEVLSSIQKEDKILGDDEYLSGAHVDKLVELIKRKVTPKEDMSAKEIQQLKSELNNMRNVLVKQQINSDIERHMKKFPDADRDEVLVKAILQLDSGVSNPDIGGIVQESHKRRTPENFDTTKLSEAQRKKIIGEEIAKIKKATAEKTQPDSGGKPPDYESEEYKKIVKSQDWDALEVWRKKQNL